MIAMMLAGVTALMVALLGTPVLIRALAERGVGQQIREDGPTAHHTKAGTPTMGGIAIVGGALIGYVVAHLRQGAVFTWGGLLVLLIAVGGCAVIGLTDDFLAVRNKRNMGLNKKAKFGALIVISGLFGVLAVELAGVQTTLSFTRYDFPGIELGTVLWVALAMLMVLASTNAVNLTDGLDGLAAGSSAFVFAAFTVISFWQFRNPNVYCVPQALDLALVAAAMAGACAGFLWWNAAPARIFMGDTGSLAIGGGIAGLALVTNTQFLLVVLGGLFVVETLSVMVQVLVFRTMHKRLFRMAPLHHHFELRGWPETVVIVRFWIIAAMFTAGALGLFYADFLNIEVVPTECPLWEQ